MSENVSKRTGAGLHLMDCRARLIGGSLLISRLERGVEVTCRFPLGDPAPAINRCICPGTVEVTESVRRSILIVDEHPVVSRGLAALIEAEPDLCASGSAQNPAGALAAAERLHPDLAILDVSLGDADGLELTAELKTRHAAMQILVFSNHDESLYAMRALRAGASGYVSKRERGEVVVAAIRCVLAGQTWMSEALQRELAAKYVRGRTMGNDSLLDPLSSRELHIFRLVGEGRSTRQIADLLSRSVKTIESHLEHIKNKLTIRSAAELAQRATRWVETGRLN